MTSKHSTEELKVPLSPSLRIEKPPGRALFESALETWVTLIYLAVGHCSQVCHRYWDTGYPWRWKRSCFSGMGLSLGSRKSLLCMLRSSVCFWRPDEDKAICHCVQCRIESALTRAIMKLQREPSHLSASSLRVSTSAEAQEHTSTLGPCWTTRTMKGLLKRRR